MVPHLNERRLSYGAEARQLSHGGIAAIAQTVECPLQATTGLGEIALELAELRRALEVGLARIDGQLALLVQRSDQPDKATEELDRRVTALEYSRWPLPAISALTGVAGFAVAVWSALAR